MAKPISYLSISRPAIMQISQICIQHAGTLYDNINIQMIQYWNITNVFVWDLHGAHLFIVIISLAEWECPDRLIDYVGD